MLAPFSPKAKTFFSSPPREDRFFTLLEGSVRSGKTWALMVKILALNGYSVAGERVLIGWSKATVYSNVLSQLFAFVGTKNYRYNSNQGRLWLYGKEWRILGVSNEGSEKAIRGATFGIVVWDEIVQAPYNVFEMVLSRLSTAGARLYGSCNPGSPYHWLYEFITDPKRTHLVSRLMFRLEDNYSLTEDTRDMYRNAFVGVFYRRNILGEWVTGDGAIFAEFWSDQENVFDDQTIPVGLIGQGGHVDRLYSVDYGTSNATCMLEWYDDGRTLWNTREWYWDSHREGRQLTDAEQVERIGTWIAERGPNYSTIIVDPSAASFKAELRSKGHRTKDANNEVLDGIRIAQVGIQRRLLKFHKANTNVAKQLLGYAWDPVAAKRGEEAPIKDNDHAVDPVRYLSVEKLKSYRLAA